MVPRGYRLLDSSHSTTRIGIACSGGGLRSGAFNLGALQRIDSQDSLKRVSFISAVSGGNYATSAYAALLSTSPGKAFSQGQDAGPRPWGQDSPEFEHLRNNSDYIAPGVPGKIFFAANYVYGFALNYLPLFLGALGTGLLYASIVEFLATLPADERSPWYFLSSRWFNVVFLLTLFVVSLLAVAVRRQYETYPPNRAQGMDRFRRIRDYAYTKSPQVATRSLTFLIVGLVGLVAIPWSLSGVNKLASWIGHRWPSTGSAPLGSPTGGLVGSSAFPVFVLLVVVVLSVLFASLAALILARWDRRRRAITALVSMVSIALVYTPFAIGVLVGFNLEHGWGGRWLLLLSIAIILFMFGIFVHANQTSMFAYYRERLSHVFCVRRTAGIASEVAVEPIPYADPIFLSSLKDLTRFPELIVCAALNISDRSTPTGRRCDSFTFSRSMSGSPSIGLYSTDSIEVGERPGGVDITVPSLMAISGAALSPVMGRLTVRSLRFFLAFMNIRLGVWLPNPLLRSGQELSKGASATHHGKDRGGDPDRQRRPRSTRFPIGRAISYVASGWSQPGALYVLKEALGVMKLTDRYIYVTDGGHWDNLGLVELVRRRCSAIVCFDATYDPQDRFEGLQIAVSLCRSELGVEVVIDPSPLRRVDPDSGGPRLASRSCVTGQILYPDQPPGRLVYSRAMVATDSPPDILLLSKNRSGFPDRPTRDQFFDDRDFEAFRTLGWNAGAIAWQSLQLPPA
jgi:hypothetical protein